MKVHNRETFLIAFPHTDTDFGTGGGCTAFYVALPNNRYVLITDGDANAPTDSDTELSFGAYEETGDYSDPVFGDGNLISWEDAAQKIRFLAGENPALDSGWLTETYKAWLLTQHELPHNWDADDLLHAELIHKTRPDVKLTPEQRKWLVEFVRLWEAAI